MAAMGFQDHLATFSVVKHSVPLSASFISQDQLKKCNIMHIYIYMIYVHMVSLFRCFTWFTCLIFTFQTSKMFEFRSWLQWDLFRHPWALLGSRGDFGIHFENRHVTLLRDDSGQVVEADFCCFMLVWFPLALQISNHFFRMFPFHREIMRGILRICKKISPDGPRWSMFECHPWITPKVLMDRLGRRGSLLLGCLGSASSMSVWGPKFNTCQTSFVVCYESL